MEDRPVIYDSSQCLWAGVHDCIITSQDVREDGRLRPSFNVFLKENARPRLRTVSSNLVDVKGAVALPLPAPMSNNRMKMPLSPIPMSPNTPDFPRHLYKQHSNQEDVDIKLLIQELQGCEHTIRRMSIINYKLESVIQQLVTLLKEK